MSLFVPLELKHSRSPPISSYHEGSNKICRAKPDLKLAESYIPGVFLYFKCLGYCCIAPILLLTQWKISILVVTFFLFMLYMDHLYLVFPNMIFIDTSAISLDVLVGTLIVMLLSLMKPCTQQCQLIFALWTLFGSFVLLLPSAAPKPLVHAVALCFFLAFIYSDLQSGAGMLYQESNNNSTTAYLHLTPSNPPLSSLSYFLRATCYVSLVLIDIYLFRPLFQQENERLFFCKYAPVLLSSWPWCLGFWVFYGMVQVFKIGHQLQPMPPIQPNTTSSSSSSAGLSANSLDFQSLLSHGHMLNNTNAQSSSMEPSSAPAALHDMDVMEAFRLAKQQYMGSKGAN